MAKNKPNKRIIIMVAAVVAVAICLVLFAAKAPQLRLSFAPSGKVSDGILPDVDSDVHIKYVPEGEIRYLINKRIVFESSYSLGNVMLENPEACGYDIKFIVYKDDGEMIYTSPLIKPGQYLEKDKLSAVLSPGEYNCSYSAQAYSDGELQGEVTGIVTVIVGQK
mgnify:FL=1